MFFQPMKLEELEKITLEYPALTEVQKEIGKKMEEYYNANNYKSIYSVATILDPRFKLAYFKGRKEFSSIKQKFLREADPYSEFCQKNTSTDSTSVDTEEEPSWINNMFKKTKKSSLDEEIKTYLAEPILPKKCDPIVYWMAKASTYPCLFVKAKKYLSIPATSTPSERAFSGGRLICHYTRGSMSSQVLSALMCSNNWIKNGLWES